MASTKKQRLTIYPCLRGEIFFIASTDCKLDHVVNNIVLLGGKIEMFFSQDVTSLLVDDLHIAEFNAFARNFSPICVRGDKVEEFSELRMLSASKSFFQGSSAMAPCSSRAYSLLLTSAASKQRTFHDNPTFRLIQRAKELGIRVTSIQQLVMFMEQQISTIAVPKRSKPVPNTRVKLSGCLIKVEDVGKRFRTFHKIFDDDPVKYLPSQAMQLVSPHMKPKSIKGSVGSSPNVRYHHANGRLATTAKDRNKPSPLQMTKVPPKVKKKQDHYCECCNVCFTDCIHHILGEQHQSFANNERNYECVKEIVDTLPSLVDFVQSHVKIERSSSAGSPLDFSMPRCSKVQAAEARDWTQPTRAICNFDDSPMASVNMPSLRAMPSQLDPNYAMEDKNALQVNDSSILDVVNTKSENSIIKFDFDWYDYKSEETLLIKEEDKKFDEFSAYCEMLVSQAPPEVAVDLKSPLDPLTSQNMALHEEKAQPIQGSQRRVSSTSSIKLEALDITQTDSPACDTKLSNESSKFLDVPKSAIIQSSDLSKMASKHPVRSQPQVKVFKKEQDEKMFSSDNSDRGGQNELISGVLTIINNSDNESKGLAKSRHDATVAPPAEWKVEQQQKPSSTKLKYDEQAKYPKKSAPLWSVQIVPSDSIRLRFTCMQDRPREMSSVSSSSSKSSIDVESEDEREVL